MRSEADRVLGRGGAFINTVGTGLVLLMIGLTIFEATGTASLGERIGDALLFGVIATYGFLTSTTCVRVAGTDLELVRLVATTAIPLSGISDVSGENGLEIVTQDGKTYTHIGYGGSLIGALTGNRRAVRVAGRIKKVLPDSASPAKAAPGVSRRPRGGLALVLIASPGLALLAMALH